MYYAVKEIEGRQVNKIFDNWDVCKIVVWGKPNALYKGFDDYEAAKKFIDSNVTLITKKTPDIDISATELHAKFTKLRYKNENGYTIGVYKTTEGQNVVCVGNNLLTNPKLTYVIKGKFVESKYGHNFEVSEIEAEVNNDSESIINFLASGFIKGIGKKKATDIYNKFGSETLDILENHTERLREVDGISERTYEKIKESYVESKGARRIAEFLLSHGLPTTNAVRLFKKYGVVAIDRIKENPYILCFYRGITFEDADSIAEVGNIAADSPIRAEFCANYILHMHERTGDTAMPLQEFGLEMYKRLNRITTTEDVKETVITKEWVNITTQKLIKLGTIKYKKIEGKQFIISNATYSKEESIAADLLRIKSSRPTMNDKNVNEAIKKAQQFLGVKLDIIQVMAVKISLITGLLVITGRPGTGKTTTINVLKEAYRILYPEKSTVFLAPSGRARRVLKEAIGEETHTIHSYCHIKSDEVVVDNLDIDPIEDSLVVIDEFSMVDVSVAQILFAHISDNCTVVLAGDMNQLESVGAGAVLRDIIESSVIPTIKLEKIFRQNDDSQISQNIKKIEDKDTNLLDGEDFKFVECSTMEEIRDVMTRTYIKFVKEYGLLNVLCLCPFIEHTAGVIEMNKILQDKINPASPLKKETAINGMKIRENDLVMHINTNNEICSNGDIGIVKEIMIDGDYKCITVDINDTLVDYEGDDLRDLTLAYAMSVYKSQGSQAKAVISCISEFHSNMLVNNIPYVAISRGRKKVEYIGQRSALNMAIKNVRKRRRNTTLSYQLKSQDSKWVKIA